MTKRDILMENGTFNRNYTKVTEQRFHADEFYDPQDLAQVKYEMLRTVRESRNGKQNVKEIANKFGFSRAGFYKIKESFEKGGVSTFVINKSGPRNARKLTSEYQEFIDGYLSDNPTASSDAIAKVLKTEKGLEVSKRTIERYRKSKVKHNRESRQNFLCGGDSELL